MGIRKFHFGTEMLIGAFGYGGFLPRKGRQLDLALDPLGKTAQNRGNFSQKSYSFSL